MPRTRTIRRALVTYLSVAIFLLGGLIWGIMYFGETELVERLCDDSMQLHLRLADQRLRGFFDPVARDVELLREMGSRGSLNVDDPDSLEPLFATLLRQNPQASAVMLADERGHEFFVSRQGDQWTSRQTRRDEWKDSQISAQWNSGAEATLTRESSNYDPRHRPWFRETIKRMPADAQGGPADNTTSDVHWTRPYRFFSSKDTGITASAWFSDAEGRNCVVALDVLLSDLQEFTRSLRVGRHGSLTFVDSYGWPIESPEDFEATANQSESKPPTERDFARSEAYAAVGALASEAQPETSAIRFVHKGQAWWTDSETFRLSAGRKWEAVVVVPERDFTVGLSTIRFWVAGVSASVLVLGVFWSVRFADRICRPLEALVHASEQIAQGNLDGPVSVASNLQEVSELAAAQEAMRSALRSLLKHEHDLQVAREIQQSTFPQSFPLVENFQIAGWSEPAEETGGDTFDVVAVQANGAARQTIYLLLADASGHGIGPALSAVRIHSLFRVAIETCENVGEIAGLINRQLCTSLPTGRFATAWVAHLDPTSRQLDSFSAGQGPILWYRAATGDVESLQEADGLPCGIMEDTEQSAGRTQCFEPGDMLAVISDGIFEATNGQDEQFGAERVAGILQSLHESSADEILAAVRNSVDQYTGGVAANDDRTIIIVKCV